MGLRVRQLSQHHHDHVSLLDDVCRTSGVPVLQHVPSEDVAHCQDVAAGGDLLWLRGVHQSLPGPQHRGHLPDPQDAHHAHHHGHPVLLVRQDLLLQDQTYADTADPWCLPDHMLRHQVQRPGNCVCPHWCVRHIPLPSVGGRKAEGVPGELDAAALLPGTPLCAAAAVCGARCRATLGIRGVPQPPLDAGPDGTCVPDRAGCFPCQPFYLLDHWQHLCRHLQRGGAHQGGAHPGGRLHRVPGPPPPGPGAGACAHPLWDLHVHPLQASRAEECSCHAADGVLIGEVAHQGVSTGDHLRVGVLECLRGSCSALDVCVRKISSPACF
uniref:Putative glucose-6-phosphate/phosphate and phosphoenolpyruvate/phosphate antiporter n=1 Tax=Ixodes ricinus TaxID=34613 RepID=A0A0K8RJX7_IXORI